MKQLVTNYRIIPASSAIQFGEFNSSGSYDQNVWYKDYSKDPYSSAGTLDLKRILTIINLENNEILYSMTDANMGGNASGNVLYLDKSITSYVGSERLEIWYDSPLPVYPVSRLSYSTGSGIFTSPDLTLDSQSCFFIIQTGLTGTNYNFTIEENYNGTYRKIYDGFITSNSVTPILTFSTTKIRVQFSLPSQTSFEIRAVPVYSTESSIYRSLTRVLADNSTKGQLEGFQFGAGSTAIEVPYYAKKVRVEINPVGPTTYIDKSTVLSASNNRIDIQTSTTSYQFTVTTGTYASPAALVTAINTAISSSGIICAYDSTSKFMEFYSSNGGIFALLFASGANNANTIANAVGFPKRDCIGKNFYVASAPMCNYTTVWLEGTNDTGATTWHRLYTSPDLVSFPVSSTNLTRYSSTSTLVEAMTALQTGSYKPAYMEIPLHGFKYIRVNSYLGTQTVDYTGSCYMTSVKLIFGEYSV